MTQLFSQALPAPDFSKPGVSAPACSSTDFVDSPFPDPSGQASFGNRDPDAIRASTYDHILRAAFQFETFAASEVREAVGLDARMINQVLRLLTDDGLLVRVSADSTEQSDASDSAANRSRRRPRFRWTEKRQALEATEWVRSKVYSNRITRAPLADRPRERLLANGPASLRVADLVAILIRSGNARESAVQAGEKISAAFAQRLEQLSEARRGDLRELSSAVGETAFCQIMAGIELGRRVAEARTRVEPRVRIQSTSDAQIYCADYFRRLASDSRHEEFHIVLLNTRYEPIGSHRVSSGTLDASLVHPREVFRPAIKEAAKALLLVHNHPSGDPTPGEQDVRVTKRLNEVSKLMGIDILDHIIVASGGTFSLRDAGLGFE